LVPRFLLAPPRPRPTLSPYTTLFRSTGAGRLAQRLDEARLTQPRHPRAERADAGQYDLLGVGQRRRIADGLHVCAQPPEGDGHRSEEHTSELQSRENLVCRLLLEKKK